MAARRTTRRDADDGVETAVDGSEGTAAEPEVLDEDVDADELETADLDEDVFDDDLDEDDLDDDAADLDDDTDSLDGDDSLQETGLDDAELEGEDTDDEPPRVAAPLPPEAEFDDDDDELVAAVTGDDDTDDEAAEIEGLRDGEFVCRSCFMAKRETQLADADRLLCRDCA